ncbi:hypothetical protein HOU02_gp069 [Caulobacter phage CcrBL9]|uniref:Uncharacterized protein n=1 Tax=Caulobacter phage CcrBL9 TaxID=2283270 RepID=A0A385EBC7_9CAUD|nr:hypothetical protein HOU02_gp069 [Caulobacter phage CcrBL9]AXQ69093.1 hypothetical protein CcrBL9_gp069c [Caulobacter phage CcrBL9]
MSREVSLVVSVGGKYARTYEIDEVDAASIRKDETIDLPKLSALLITKVDRTFTYRDGLSGGPLRLSHVEIDTVSL